MEDKRLEEFMNERGTNTRQLAMAAGLPYSTVRDVVIQKRTLEDVATGKVLAIARALGMTVEQLLGEEPPALTADEVALLDVYRSLPTFAQKMAMAMVENIAEGLRDE